ncbi:hypothetical protein KAX08_05730 [candidate division WOR-3 bacterium]|nr:hypothetical protein [candidate division WOR-3 bacterium]
MAGIIDVTVALGGMRSLTKEVPAYCDLQPAIAATEGYISVATISFTHNAAAADTINDSGNGFTTANFVASDDEMILVESTSGLNDGLYTIAGDEQGVITLLSTDVLITESAADAGTVTLTCVAVYKITPTRGTGKLLIVYSEGVEATGELGLIPCLLNGDYWAAKNPHYTQFTATTVTDTTLYLFVETAPYLQDDGSMYLMLKPIVTSTQLYTDHRPAAGFIELP